MNYTHYFPVSIVRILWNWYRRIDANSKFCEKIASELVAVRELVATSVHEELIADVQVLDSVESVVIRRSSRYTMSSNNSTCIYSYMFMYTHNTICVLLHKVQRALQSQFANST